MSPEMQNRRQQIAASSNLYTVILGLAFAVVLATALLVTYKCYTQYGTVFKMP